MKRFLDSGTSALAIAMAVATTVGGLANHAI